eukprot:PITA_22491
MGEQGSQVWEMFFDGACLRETAGARVVLISPKQESTNLSFKLAFQVTDNIAEYEALILGLNAAKDKIRNVKVFGDVDLIIQQVNKTFQKKHPRLKAYRDEHWKVFEDDDEVNRFLQVIDEFSEMQVDQENEALEESTSPNLETKLAKITLSSCPTFTYLRA